MRSWTTNTCNGADPRIKVACNGEHEATTRTIINEVQSGAPEADVVVVSSMPDNQKVFKDGRVLAFRDVLFNIVMPNVALVDMTMPWMKMLERKEFSDLSGNNINHPNDFGHRLYAQVICELFRERQPHHTVDAKTFYAPVK